MIPTQRQNRCFSALDTALIFGVALAIRIYHLHALSFHDPFYALPSVDDAVYDARSKEILAGQWLGEGVLFMGPGYSAFMSVVYAVPDRASPHSKQCNRY